MDFYYPVLACLMGVGAYIITAVAVRYMRTKKLNYSQWVDEVEHVLIERIRAGVQVAECDERIAALIERSSLPKNEAVVQVLDIAKKVEAAFHRQLQEINEPAPVEAVEAKQPIVTVSSDLVWIGGQLVKSLRRK